MSTSKPGQPITPLPGVLPALSRSAAPKLPANFFDPYLGAGRAVILLDGLDEVADSDLRRRASRLVEAFCRAYPACRYVITSRIVGYEGAARLGEDFTTTTVRDFTLQDVRRFLTNWYRLVAAGQMGPGPSADAYAAEQTGQLYQAIVASDRIRELALNPLLLTVIAMVHRDRVKLPDRRAELYAEAVDVLLGKWDEARGVQEVPVLAGESFDTGDKRLMLQSVALGMQEQAQKEIPLAELRQQLGTLFYDIVRDWRTAGRAVDRFLGVITERTGLLVARGEGVYTFSHLTFQEYLAALALVERADYIPYALAKTADPGWREVILLAAGHLSTQGKERVSRFIEAIARQEEEPDPYHNLVLAAVCLHDAGQSRVAGNLLSEVQQNLRAELEAPVPENWLGKLQTRLARGMSAEVLAERRVAAAQALAQVGGQTYWTKPYGEPAWVEIPAGEFWLGGVEDRRIKFEKGTEVYAKKDTWLTLEQDEEMIFPETPQHRLHLDKFFIARTPITNAQYHLFVEATAGRPPSHWEADRPPQRLAGHPVVNVSWPEALAYCHWLGGMTGQVIALPSEAQWEKAARGERDKRIYPWGDPFETTYCNSWHLGLHQTTPAGIFPAGVSPYGCLDMAGNVWEWTRTLWGEDWRRPTFNYPYDPADGREDLEAGDEVRRGLRGGSFLDFQNLARCAARLKNIPDFRYYDYGFRVVLSP